MLLCHFFAFGTSDQFFRIDDETNSPAISSSFGVMLFWYGHRILRYQVLFTALDYSVFERFVNPNFVFANDFL
jgi:hypothetical protein